MTQGPAPAAAQLPPVPTARKSPWRSIAAGLCFLLSFLLTVPAVVGFWGQRTLTDAERYVATVGPIAEDPAVKAAITEVINENLVAQLDVDALLQEWLPPEARPLAGPIAGAVNSFIEKEVAAFVESDRFDELWVAINAGAQQALVGILSGEPTGPIEIQGADVVLDLGELITEVRDRLVARGLTVLSNVSIPAAADRQIVLLHSEQLAQARTIYAFSVPIARWLIVIVLALAVAAIFLARRRPRMVVTVGAGLIVSMILLRLALKAAETYLGTTAPDATLSAATEAFFNHLTVFLVTAIRLGYAIGILMIIFGWLFGGTRSAISSRNAINRAVGGAGSKAADTGSLAAAGSWVAPKRTALIVAVIAVAGLVLILADPLTAGLLLATTLGVLVGVGIVLVLAAAAPKPAAEPVADSEAGEPAGVGQE